jgi:hypothetical protein
MRKAAPHCSEEKKKRKEKLPHCSEEKKKRKKLLHSQNLILKRVLYFFLFPFWIEQLQSAKHLEVGALRIKLNLEF